VEVWGEGTALRAYTYIEDMLDGIILLMHSDLEDGVNIGRREYVTVDELVQTIAGVAGKDIKIRHIEGPVGVQARNFTVKRIHSIGWQSKYSLKQGIERTYPWIKEQVDKKR
jgi:nucleoside-diphosphate-sugar epimerase